jgi:hypothetical protein
MALSVLTRIVGAPHVAGVWRLSTHEILVLKVDEQFVCSVGAFQQDALGIEFGETERWWRREFKPK